ncbi:MAG: hypothetical protein K0R09_356 [Clostridiales bacterium]|jgi:predicted Rossmann fold flavoprotein|nr:hypothetical protein [Clostridiales bacterium]
MAGRRVIIVGGGAAGMTAGIVARRNGAQVVVLEQMNRVGKKILATGNGRCNLTNENIDIKRYHGRNHRFAMSALEQFNMEQTVQFFEYMGVSCKSEDGGKVYPRSDQSSSVLDVMRYEIEKLEIDERVEAGVKSIHPGKKEFTVVLRDGEELKGDRVVIAAGGKAAPNLGSNGSGYGLVTPFGHKLIDPFPALVQLKLNAQFLKALKGVKFIGAAAVGAGDEELRREMGEVLFTDYGISGPPILQLSRRAGEQLQTGRKPWIEVDMFPGYCREELGDMLSTKLGYQPQKPLDFSFVGLINKRLIPVVLKEAGVDDIKKQCQSIKTNEFENIIRILKNWRFEVMGTNSWSDAQVTAGGIDVSDINQDTMESKLIPGLYFAGEVLDIDGDCGGFNLQWAWSSGYVAGINASL